MKFRLLVILLCASLLPAVQARAKDKIVLPDSCGDEGIKFEVKTLKEQPLPAPPSGGKAQIIFIGEGHAFVRDFTYQTYRYGLNGAWVGGNYDDSYFAITVDPGVHHLCVNWQDKKKPAEAARYSAVDSFTSEPGKTYYYSSRLIRSGPAEYVLRFSQLDEETGKFRIKAWKLATSTPKK
jgi:hypothetical protein